MGILTQRKKVFRWQQMYYYRKDTQKKNNQLFAFFELAQSSVTSEALIAQHPHRGHLEQRGSKAGKKQTNKKNKQDEEKTSKRAWGSNVDCNADWTGRSLMLLNGLWCGYRLRS